MASPQGLTVAQLQHCHSNRLGPLTVTLPLARVPSHMGEEHNA